MIEREAKPTLQEVLAILRELREQGLIARATYRLTGPYGSGMSRLFEEERNRWCDPCHRAIERVEP